MKKLNFVFFVLFLVSLFAPTVKADCKVKPPTRPQLEKLYGQPVKCNPAGAICLDKENKRIDCPKDSETMACFNIREGVIKAEFDASGKVKVLSIFDGCNYNRAVEIATQLAPAEQRGKFLKKVET